MKSQGELTMALSINSLKCFFCSKRKDCHLLSVLSIADS